MRASNELPFGETYINRENFEAIQGFHAGWCMSGIGGADGKHGVYEFTQTHVVARFHRNAPLRPRRLVGSQIYGGDREGSPGRRSQRHAAIGPEREPI
jgi:hypothetical protein